MPTYLDAIVAHHRELARLDTRSASALEEAAAGSGTPRPFAAALARPGMSVIAEIKRRSPSRGALALDLDPAALARAYAAGGASCLSVLTDEEYFGGHRDDLVAARRACELPVLRKDFTVSIADVYDARAMGADAVLLIVAALSDEELRELSGVARALGLAALVEVHDSEELDRARRADAQIIGVNQRDLRTFAVDHERAVRLRAEIPAGIVTVAESGIRDAADLARLASAGYDGALIGEALVTAGDPAGTLAGLLSVAAG